MGRAAALFVASSIALHGAALRVLVAAPAPDRASSAPAPAPDRAARDPDPIPVLLEGANVATRASSASPAPPPPSAAGAPVAAPRPRLAPPSAPGRAPEGPSGVDASPAGAAATLFGTSVLRAFLVAISADPRALRDAAGPYRIRYEGGAGAAVRVSAEPRDAASERMGRALEALIAAAGEGLPAIAGALAIDVEAADGAEGLFAITCDEAQRRGAVRFVDGRRVRVDEAR